MDCVIGRGDESLKSIDKKGKYHDSFLGIVNADPAVDRGDEALRNGSALLDASKVRAVRGSSAETAALAGLKLIIGAMVIFMNGARRRWRGEYSPTMPPSQPKGTMRPRESL